MGGAAIRSCITPVSAVRGEVTTLEGLSKNGKLHPLQEAFVTEQAPQCGYCYNGMTIKGAELLSNNPNPTDAEIREAMRGHICRCGTYPRIVAAIQRAAADIRRAQ